MGRNSQEQILPPYLAARTKDFTGREWVFEAIDAWLGTDKSCVFLLTGGPGTGKSALAARLVQLSRGEVPSGEYHYLTEGAITFFHFCQAFNDPTLAPLRFVESLSRHLADRFQCFARALTELGDRQIIINARQRIGTAEGGSEIKNVVIESMRIGNVSARAAFDRTVRQPLEQLYANGHSAPITILVDALDEALTYPGETIVELLGHATDNPQDLPRQVHLLLTSRPDDRVIDYLGNPSLDLLADEPHPSQDIRAYAYRRLEGLTGPRQDELSHCLAQKGKGNFLYVRHIIDQVLPTIDEVTDLSELSLPEDLEDQYRQFLKREMAPTREHWRQVSPLLGLLAVAREGGLTREHLMGIAGLAPSEIDDLLEVCMQYLSGSRPEGPFRIYHESFREFLLADQTYPVYAAEANQAIADYFLKVYGSRWHECKDRYAVAYTPVHLVESIWQTEEPLRRGERSEKLASLLEDFCFLEAKAGQVSVDDLLVDLHTATALELVRSGSLLELPDLLKVLEREGANLSGWDQELRPAFFAQQVLNRCKDMQLHGLAGVARARLKELGFPYFELRWRAGPLDAEEKRYHSTFSFWNAYTVSSLAVTPDGRLVVSAHLDGSLKVWDNATGRKVRTLMGHEAMVLAVAVTPDGLRAVSGSQDSTLKVWDLKTGRVQHTLVGHEGTIFTVRITPDGQRAVSRADDGLVRLWDLNSGQSLHALGKPKHPYYFSPALEEDGMENDLPDLYYGISEYALAVTPDSRRAIAALSGGFRLDGTLPGDVVKVWDLDTGLEVYALDGHSGQVVSIAVSPDGRRAVSASDDGTVKVWDLKLGRLAHTLSGHSDQVQAVLVTTDSRLVVSASLDSTVKVWDLSTGGLLRTLIGHGGQLYALASSADGRCIISGSFEGFLTVWSMQSGQELASVAVEGERPQLAIQQRNGILAGASDGDVYCLDYVEPSRPDPIADSSGGPNPRK